MKTVYKFHFTNKTMVWLLPASATPLKIAMQGDKPTMWVLVDTEESGIERCFEIYGTGVAMPEDGRARTYVDTYFTGPFVFHVFEVWP